MKRTTKRACLGVLTAALAMSMGATAYAATPSSTDKVLDLRNYNGTVTYDKDAGRSIVTGGINYVTPVKNQNPFNSCWSFSVISAAETSMLTSLDKADDGKMNGSVDYEKAASGKAGTAAYAASDLSERHLAVSVFSHPKTTSIYSDQAGEGRYLLSGNTDGASVMDVGGMPLAGISAFSCGIGPMPESTAPYISDEGYIQGCLPVIVDANGNFKVKQFTDYETAVETLEKAWTPEAFAKAYKEFAGEEPTDEMVDYYISTFKKPTLSKKGTWSIETADTYGAVAELCNSNMLEVASGDGLDETEKASMKEELAQGRPVSITFKADQSQAGQAMASNTYINTKTWAQYTYEPVTINHGVTVVGWDDDYDKSNFTHDIYKTDKDGKVVYEDGEPVVGEEATAKTTPKSNGAWIVKNSWGYSGDGDPLTRSNWGVDGSGYFYLSYEDKGISGMETYEFDLSKKAQARTGYATAQYDLSKSTNVESISYDSVCKTCNVFGDGDGEDANDDAYTLRDLGFLTGTANDTVTLEVYVMAESQDAASVIAKGKPTLTTSSEKYTYAGFHRISLKSALIIKGNQKVAVVQTTKQASGKYECAFFYGNSEALSDSAGATFYTKTVVNKGESLEFRDGAWKDWSEELTAMGEKCLADTYAPYIASGQATQEEYEQDVAAGRIYAVDNFSIKLYADSVVKTANGLKLSKSSKTVKNNKKRTFKIVAKGANGKVTFKGGTKKIKVNAKGMVTVKKGAKPGKYKIKVTAAGDLTHNAVTKTFTVRVKKGK